MLWGLPDGAPLPNTVNQKAVASLVLGLLSFCLLFLTAIPAIILGMLAIAQIRASQGRERGHALAVIGITTGVLGTLLGTLLLLVPGLAQNRQRLRGNGCVRNLREIGAAMQRYHKKNQHFPPPAIIGKQGERLLSWRVDLLREIDPDLFREFHLDEPWDSPHNITLVPRMPKMFGCPIDAAKRPGMTHFQAVIGPTDPGPHTAFQEGRGVSIDEFKDGPSATVLLAEAANSVPWTSPHDLHYQPAPWFPPPKNDERDLANEGLVPQFTNRHANTFNILRADGSAGPFRSPNRGNALRALLTRDGMENVGGG